MTIEPTPIPATKPKTGKVILQLLRDVLALAHDEEFEYIEITMKRGGKINSMAATRTGRIEHPK